MKPKSQIAILKTIVKWQAEEIDTLEALLWLAKKAHPVEPHPEICDDCGAWRYDPLWKPGDMGDTETLTVTVSPKWEDGDAIEAV